MLNNWMNFQFSIMKNLWDLANEKLVNIIGRHGILDQYSWMSVNDHLCTIKISSKKTIGIVRDSKGIIKCVSTQAELLFSCLAEKLEDWQYVNT